MCGDIGQRDRMYKFRLIYPGICGIIFMIDLTDHYRYDEAINELKSHIDMPETSGLPILIMCNKTDLIVTIDIEKVRETMNLILKERVWEIIGTSVIKGVGIKESINWMSKAVVNS